MLDTLENKFRLATMAPLDRRMKRKHLAVYGFLLDWYHRKYGDALASVRHIAAQLKERDPAGVGLYLGDVHSALKDLEAWGYITASIGKGQRASRYVPVWVHGSCVRETPNDTEDEISVRENQNTSVRRNTNTTVDCVRQTPNEDPVTGPGLQTEVRVSGNKFSAPATPPLAVGLGATAAEGAEGEASFEDFWNAWPRKHGIKKARAEWAKIADEQRQIVEAAVRWADHYQKHGTDKKWIAEPANWLAGERWMEDLPIIHGDAKGAAIAKARANAPQTSLAGAAKDNVRAEESDVPYWLVGRPSSWPVGMHTGEFTKGQVTNDGNNTEVCMTFTRTDGREFKHRFWVEASTQSYQEEGQQIIRDIVDALGMAGVEDTDDLLFKPIAVEADGSKLNYFNIKETA
ncbi:hypothetical protein FY136_06220 [Agrobacterium tumefaciens]|uniref:hypothetical protein n=1 Tax=Agrobacterium tumefaciens TaxID=358 RepID=UPI0021D38778|nr:hypothetical protein [Agrobacterium tumefaciens]UXT48858.1 hypothetical protein FY136_06220 [Agrobacterium tumefaciens]